MIPSVVAHELISSLREFLQKGFQPSNESMRDLIDEFLAQPDSLTKGPFIDLALPFKKAQVTQEPFESLQLGFQPFEHQVTAFSRLTGRSPSSTLVTTGTGSGKTECFMYPLLEHCALNTDVPGIKAIVIYPMNALATDQAQRFAQKVHESPKLKGTVRVGLYTGDSNDDRKQMTPEYVIESRYGLREQPPDILLTNYRMLDLLLMRPRDKPLWSKNIPESLRYLVVDELHTFDGAQGTDLACLIRRLKHARQTAEGQLVCVGTSATIANRDPDSLSQDNQELCDFAAMVFGESFSSESIVTESRLSMAEFIDDKAIEHVLSIDENCSAVVDPYQYETADAFVDQQYELFFGEPLDRNDESWTFDLSERLLQHATFRRFLDRVTETGKLQTIRDLTAEIAQAHSTSLELAESLVNSLCTLISVARRKGERGTSLPFVNLRMHGWIRELRRMVARVDVPSSDIHESEDGEVYDLTEGGGPRIQFSDDLPNAQGTFFPLLQCRECRTSGWAALLDASGSKFETNLQRFYRSFFDRNLADGIRVLYPDDESSSIDMRIALCVDCQTRHGIPTGADVPSRCGNQECGSSNLVVLRETRLLPTASDTSSYSECQYCRTTNSLVLFGAQIMTQMSTLLSQLYGTQYNNDQKAIVFSDNVQDAAHRASFIGSRTWRDVMTAAILQTLPVNSRETISLEQVVERLVAHFNNVKTLDQSQPHLLASVCKFLPPDLFYLNDYARIQNDESLGDQINPNSLTNLVKRRMRWEAFSQFTFDSLSRRSLERHHEVAIGVNLSIVEKSAEELLQALTEEIGLKAADEQTVVRLLLGILRIMRLAGSVTFGVRSLDSALARGKTGIRFALGRDLALRDFGPNTPAPRYLAMQGSLDQQFFEDATRRNSNYLHWIEDNLFPRDQIFDASKARDALRLALNALTKAELVKPPVAGGMPAYAIDSRCLFITRDTAILTPDGGKGPSICVPQAERDYWIDSPTLFVREDKYSNQSVNDTRSSDALISLFKRREPTRIRPAEHTALLEQDTRKLVQEQFSAPESKPWFPNLVSATPTLELGVDIGDLSAIAMCTVPPTPANYVQRVGRAGRRTGNALTLTTAAGRPHDLYYFADPQEMLVASIETPGMYMNAAAVLRRQLAAFCFDTWVTNEQDVAIPDQLGQLLASYNPEDTLRFPGNFLKYVALNAADLFKDFCGMFRHDEITPKTRSDLMPYLSRQILSSDPVLHTDLLGVFKEVEDDLGAIKRDIEALRREKIRLENLPSDEVVKDQLQDITRQMRGLSAVASNIRQKNTLEFLTNEGILPNYAFPESGITLRSVIFSRSEDGESPNVNAFDYIRPASSALSEFAPDQRFYAEARRVQITRVEVSDEDSVQDWRLCPVCSHLERSLTADKHAQCPRCGSQDFLDAGAKVRMLALRLVHAQSGARESQIHDDLEYREPRFFSRSLIPDFDSEPEDRYVSSTSICTLEFHPSVTFRDVNFGEAGAYYDKKIKGLEDTVTGFEICTRCGAVAGEDREIQHLRRICANDEALEKCLFIYREFQSEALRIVLPFDDLALSDDEKAESLIAAMEFGLRKRFKGQVTHLRFMIAQQALADQQLHWCLVLYDTIPGGTGYIKDLMQEGEFAEFLRNTLEGLEECACAEDLDTDGCYRCVYQYYRQMSAKKATRSVAVKAVKEFLDAATDFTISGTDPFETTREIEPPVSIDNLFLHALRAFQVDGTGTPVKETIDQGHTAWTVIANDQIYSMRTQVPLFSPEVSIPCRPDFVLRPMASNSSQKEIAIFLDGFNPHWELGADDSAKRLSLVRDGYTVWSFSYRDLRWAAQSNSNTQPEHLPDLLRPDEVTVSGGIRQVQTQLDESWGTTNQRRALTSNPIELFVRYLRNPDHEQWRRAMFIELLGLANVDQGSVDLQSPSVARIEETIPELDRTHFYERVENELIVGSCDYPSASPDSLTEVHIALSTASLGEEPDPRSICAVVHQRDLQSSKSEEWNRAWNASIWLWNRLQFCRQSWWTTEKGLSEGSYEIIKPLDLIADFYDLVSTDFSDTEDLINTSLLPEDITRALLGLSSETPEVGYEWVDDKGNVVADAELVWPASKVAVLFDDQFNDYVTASLDANEWRLFLAADEELIEHVRHALGGH